MSFLKFAKWQTRRYVPAYELGAANLMIELFTVTPPPLYFFIFYTKASVVEAVDSLQVPDSNRAQRYSHKNGL